MLYCPTRIIFGIKALDQAQTYLSELGHKALIVCGTGSPQKSGALAELEQVLRNAEIQYAIFASVEANPSLETVMAGKEMLLREQCEFVIGLGGGSPLDAAKAISLAAANDLSQEEIYATSRFHQAFPIVAVPTTSGTGSEVTQYSVLTNYTTKTKAGFGHVLAVP